MHRAGKRVGINLAEDAPARVEVAFGVDGFDDLADRDIRYGVMRGIAEINSPRPRCALFVFVSPVTWMSCGGESNPTPSARGVNLKWKVEVSRRPVAAAPVIRPRRLRKRISCRSA
jgi:hypothetical protein